MEEEEVKCSKKIGLYHKNRYNKSIERVKPIHGCLFSFQPPGPSLYNNTFSDLGDIDRRFGMELETKLQDSQCEIG